MSENNPIIGKNYEVIDTYGMMASVRKFIGIGYKYESYDGIKYYKGYTKYYIFERLQNELSTYKYAACRPYFNELEFCGFKVERYGNSLPHLFVDFKQDYFSINDKNCIESPSDFNLTYNDKKQNSGPRGSFICYNDK